MKNLFLVLFLLTTSITFSQETIKIGVKESTPFVVKYDDGKWGGLCIDIVENLSNTEGFKYELIEINGTYDEAIELIEQDSLDMLALDMTISASRLEKVNFTQPYYSTPTGIATKSKKVGLVDKLTSKSFITSLLISLGVIFFLALLIWLAELKYDSKIRNSPVGIFDALYFTIVTLSTVGYGDITPSSKFGKFLTTIIIIASLFMVATLTGMISSSLTVTELEGQTTTMSDLNKLKTGTISGTFSEKLLMDNDIKTINFNSPMEAFEAINDNELDAFVYDRAILNYLSSLNKFDNISVSENTFNNQTYGFVLKKGDTLIERINPSILKLINSDRWGNMLSQYKID